MQQGPKVSGLTYKSRTKWKMLWGIYIAIYGEVNVAVEKCVEIKGDYVEKQQICFISVTLKSWSGRKLLGPTTQLKYQLCYFITKTYPYQAIIALPPDSFYWEQNAISQSEPGIWIDARGVSGFSVLLTHQIISFVRTENNENIKQRKPLKLGVSKNVTFIMSYMPRLSGRALDTTNNFLTQH